MRQEDLDEALNKMKETEKKFNDSWLPDIFAETLRFFSVDSLTKFSFNELFGYGP